MLAGMPHSMIMEWMAFDQVEPIGMARRLETILAAQMTLTANVHRGRNRRAFEVSDFLPMYGPPRERPPEQVWKELRLWAMMNGAKKT